MKQEKKAENRFPLVSDGFRTADRTAFRQTIRNGIFSMFRTSQDFWNNVAGFPDNDFVTDTNIFFRDKILIVQGSS